MGKKEIVVNDDYRMKVVNFLKIYGYYSGVLSKREYEKGYIDGTLPINQIILNKADFKELKLSVRAVIDYCYEHSLYNMSDLMEYFYKVECEEIRKKYGGFFDK